MALKSGLEVWCYTAPGQQYYSPAKVNYGRIAESLKFSSVQPGGFGTLTCRIPAATVRIPRPELALFSRLAVMAPSSSPVIGGTSRCVWLGEITQPEITLDERGEYYTIQALGIGNCLRDDPGNVAYLNQTGPAILNDQMTRDFRATWMPISTDQSGIFPDNPATTISPSYMGYAFQDVLQDVCLELGQYSWGVWAHPTQVDSTWQMPLGQLLVHLTNTSTTNYQAFLLSGDIYSWKISPAADRAYNAVTLAYNDPAHGGFGVNSVSDPRLGASLQQQTAPFRFRRYYQDFSGVSTIGLTQAQAIQNTQLAVMKNVSNKTQVVLRGCRNAQGSPIPLWAVQADANINIPELAQRGQLLVLAATPTVNLFYILSAEYYEDASGVASCTLQCDNWYDFSQIRLARLENQAYNLAQNGTVTSQVQAIGSPDTGVCGFQTYNGNAGATQGEYVQFHAVLAQAPTSITLTSGGTTNATGIAASSLGVYGFYFSWTATAVGNTQATRQYQTVGNCLTAVDTVGGTITQHCDVCGQVNAAIPMVGGVAIVVPQPQMLVGGSTPYGLSYTCPACGTTESFNTTLTQADAVPGDNNSPDRAAWAALILQMQGYAPLQQAIATAITSAGGTPPPISTTTTPTGGI